MNSHSDQKTVEALRTNQLRRVCDPDSLGFETTSELAPLNGFVDQDRALQGLRMGIGDNDKSSHIRVIQANGASKTSALVNEVRTIVREVRAVTPIYDTCAVYNFDDQNRPQVLMLPAGEGEAFRRKLEKFGRELTEKFSEFFYGPRAEILEELRNKIANSHFESVETELRTKFDEFGINLKRIFWKFQDGHIAPSIEIYTKDEDKPLPGKNEDDLFIRMREWANKYIEDEQKNSEFFALMEDMHTIIPQTAKGVDSQMNDELQEPDANLTKGAIKELFDNLFDSTLFPTVSRYVNELKEFLYDNYGVLLSQTTMGPVQQPADNAKFFAVNVLVDNSGISDGAVPVIFEENPTYENLLGTKGGKEVGQAVQGGVMYQMPDHTTLKAGALPRANGGVLILNLLDVLQEPMSELIWKAFTSYVRNQEFKFEKPMTGISGVPSDNLQVEAIPLNVRIVLVVPKILDVQLSNAPFPQGYELFRTKAEFATDTERTRENENKFARIVHNWVSRERMPAFDSGAVALVLEQASRLAESQNRLSLDFTNLKDLTMQAAYWARQRDSDESVVVEARDVQMALDQKFYRSNLIVEHFHEMTRDGSINLMVDGEVVGRINALSVIQLGDFMFGRPNVITATCSLGTGQVIRSVDVAAKMMGPSAQKSFGVIEGWLRGNFGRSQLISVNSQVVFEQIYNPLDGDSASLAELYTVLSSITQIPLKQSIAITGSCNQQGDVQSVGGVTEKIEGFFDACFAKGELTGEQGVIIPALNVQSLMLRPDVVDAVASGKFNVWAIKDVEEGIAIMTGMEFTEFREQIEEKLNEFAKNAVTWQKQYKDEKFRPDDHSDAGDPDDHGIPAIV